MEKYHPTESRTFPAGGYLDVEEKILLFLKDHPNSPVNEIRHGLGISKLTFNPKMFKLIDEGKVGFRRVGSEKLCFLKEDT